MNWDKFPFTRAALEEYLSGLYDEPVRITAISGIGEKQTKTKTLKAYGYGKPLLIEVSHNGEEQRLVFHTMSGDRFGHERTSDRARNQLLDHATFNKLPQHVPSLDVGAFSSEEKLISLGEAGEFFHLTRFIPGQPYAYDFQRISDTGELDQRDEERTIALAEYLAKIHALKHNAPPRYQRCIRDLIGHGEGIMGMLDAFPLDFALAPPERLEAIEKRCVEWRWRIKESGQRLSQVHGDFHPWNVLFRDDNTFTLLDRSRGEWGEPADDVSAMSINYILFSVRRYGELAGPFLRLYRLFWDSYLEQTKDDELLKVIQPFYAWRGVVVAHPIWYPDLADSVREKLFRFVERVLQTDAFEPERVNDYLQ